MFKLYSGWCSYFKNSQIISGCSEKREKEENLLLINSIIATKIMAGIATETFSSSSSVSSTMIFNRGSMGILDGLGFGCVKMFHTLQDVSSLASEINARNSLTIIVMIRTH